MTDCVAVSDNGRGKNCNSKDSYEIKLKNGKLIGLLRRWDDEDKLIAEECEYVNGMMNGYRKLYFFDPDGNKYTNIEYFEDNLPVETIQIEW